MKTNYCGRFEESEKAANRDGWTTYPAYSTKIKILFNKRRAAQRLELIMKTLAWFCAFLPVTLVAACTFFAGYLHQWLLFGALLLAILISIATVWGMNYLDKN